MPAFSSPYIQAKFTFHIRVQDWYGEELVQIVVILMLWLHHRVPSLVDATVSVATLMWISVVQMSSL